MSNIKEDKLTKQEMIRLVGHLLNDPNNYFTKLDVRGDGSTYKVRAITFSYKEEAEDSQ